MQVRDNEFWQLVFNMDNMIDSLRRDLDHALKQHKRYLSEALDTRPMKEEVDHGS